MVHYALHQMVQPSKKKISLIDDLFANVIWNINQKNTTKNINSNKKKKVKSIDTNNQSIDNPSLDY